MVSRQRFYVEMITADDYQDLLFMAELPRGNVLAPAPFYLTVSPITGHKATENISDKFKLKHAKEFFSKNNCDFRDALIKVYDIDYVISRQEISCEYKLLRSENNYIYQVSN